MLALASSLAIVMALLIGVMVLLLYGGFILAVPFIILWYGFEPQIKKARAKEALTSP